MTFTQKCGIMAAAMVFGATGAFAFGLSDGFSILRDSNLRMDRFNTETRSLIGGEAPLLADPDVFVAPTMQTPLFESAEPAAAAATSGARPEEAPKSTATDSAETGSAEEDAAPHVFEVQTSIGAAGLFTVDFTVQSAVPMSIVVNSSVDGNTVLYSVAIELDELQKARDVAAENDRQAASGAENANAVPLPLTGVLLLSAIAGLGLARRGRS